MESRALFKFLCLLLSAVEASVGGALSGNEAPFRLGRSLALPGTSKSTSFQISQANVFFCASLLDRRPKELYARCSKLSMSLAHWRRCGNYISLTRDAGGYLEPSPVSYRTDIDADDFVS